MPVRRLLVLFQGHHVHRAHLLDALAQRLAGFFLGGQKLIRKPLDGFIGAHQCSFQIDLAHAGRFLVLQVGTQLGLLAGAAGAVFAQLIQRGAAGLELRLHGCQLLP